MAIAGGIGEFEIPKLRSVPLDIIIVGGAITRTENPGIIAEKIRNLIHNSS